MSEKEKESGGEITTSWAPGRRGGSGLCFQVKGRSVVDTCAYIHRGLLRLGAAFSISSPMPHLGGRALEGFARAGLCVVSWSWFALHHR